MSTRLVLPRARRPAPVVRAAAVPKPPSPKPKPPPPPPRPPEPPRPAASAAPETKRTPERIAADIATDREAAARHHLARLAALVPPGSWPATLPTTAEQPVRPLEVGIRQRVAALLPEVERPALARALARYCGSRRYLEAVAAGGAVRWSDGGAPRGPVREGHRAAALRDLAKLLEGEAEGDARARAR